MSRELSYRAALGEALREALDGDERVLLLGQDIGARGGSFGVTAGLLERFGPERVRDAPSSEAALVGVAIGAALAGLRPVAELTTAAFAALAHDQILHQAAPLRALSGGRLSAPLVLRIPQGSGTRLGPIHTQNVEALLHHIPGLVVAVPATPADAKGLLAAAIASEDPVLFLEHAALYDHVGELGELGAVAPLGRAAIRREGRDVTVVGSSRMALLAEAAAATLAAEHGIDAEVVDLRTVRPLDAGAVLASARRTGHAVLVEEGWPAGGVAATLAARIAEAAPGTRVARVSGADVPVPYAAALHAAAIPGAAAIVTAVRTLLEQRPATPPSAAAGHELSATIDMEALLAAFRDDGAATSLAAVIAARCAPVLGRLGRPDVAVATADGDVALLGAAHSDEKTPRRPALTLSVGAIAARPTADGGAVTVRRRATATLRIAPGQATGADAEAIWSALRSQLEQPGR